MAKQSEEVSAVRRARHGGLLTALFTVISIIWISPLFLVLMNSFKKKAFIFRNPFSISANPLSDGWDAFVEGIERAFHGWTNYANAIKLTNFIDAFGTSLFITVVSVIVIIVCTSMCAWYITRVNSIFSKMQTILNPYLAYRRIQVPFVQIHEF